MRLVVKFNLALITAFIIGFAAAGLVSRALLLENARDGDPPERADDHGLGAGVARLHQRTDRAAPQEARHRRVPAADGAGVRRHRAVQRAPRAVPRLRLQGGDAQPDEPPRQGDRLGGRHREPVPPGTRTRTRSSSSATRPPGASCPWPSPSRSRTRRASRATAPSTPRPASLLRKYGPANGFGWQLHDVIGAQIVSVPMALPIKRAETAFFAFMSSMARHLPHRLRPAQRHAHASSSCGA